MTLQLDTRKNAVLQVCDAGYLPFTLHLMNQIIRFYPNRTFDLVIASEDDLALPQWAQDAGILFYRMGTGDLPPDLPLGHFVRGAFYRIKVPDQLVSRYRRILYLDGDILMEGGDLDRLLGIGMDDHPLPRKLCQFLPDPSARSIVAAFAGRVALRTNFGKAVLRHDYPPAGAPENLGGIRDVS